MRTIATIVITACVAVLLAWIPTSSANALAPITSVYGGVGGHFCALDADGAAYCWGLNQSGQVGDGTTIDRAVPTAVAGGVAFKKLAVGNGHTCGLTNDSKLYCWGDNSFGDLGDGTTNARSTPILIAGGYT